MASGSRSLGLRDDIEKSKGNPSGSSTIPRGQTSSAAKAKTSKAKERSGAKRKSMHEGDEEEDEETRKEKERKKIARKDAREAAKTKEANRMNVGIDIGTTYTAIAYAFGTTSPDRVMVLDEWPSEKQRTEEKCPSKIAYASGNGLTRNKWGYEVVSGMEAYAWWKLLLDKHTKPTDFDSPLLAKAVEAKMLELPPGKTAVKVMQDFLVPLREYFFKKLRDSMLETALEQIPFRIVVTVPATWGYSSREATRQAVRKAGFAKGEHDEIMVIDEPEAATLSVLRTMETSGTATPPKENTVFTCCDLGGGTLDLSSYKVIKFNSLQLEEACVGEGGKAGGTTIDCGFNAMMLERFGDAFRSLPNRKVGSSSDFMKTFEQIKRNFDGEEDSNSEFELPLKMKMLDPDDKELQKHYNFEEDVVKISSNDLVEMFKPVLDKLFVLLPKQIERTEPGDGDLAVNRIIAACGGLSRNDYVFKRLKAFIEDAWGTTNVQVVRPIRPWPAIAEGAVLSAMGKSPVISRKSRNHVLMVTHEKFDPAKHRASDRFTCPQFGARADNQLKCIVARGEKLKPNLKTTVKCYHAVHNPRAEISEAVVRQEFYRSSEDTTPQRVDDPSVFSLGVIDVDLTAFARKKRAEERKKSGGRYSRSFRIDVDIELTMSSSKGILEATAKVDKKKVGSTTIRYAPAPAWDSTLAYHDDDETYQDDKVDEGDRVEDGGDEDAEDDEGDEDEE